MKICKYEIPEKERFTLEIPGKPRFLSVGVQALRHGLPPRDTPVLWVMISEPDAEPTAHQFRVVATGEDFDLPLHASYLGTFQIDGFVGHLFYLPP